MATTSHQLFLSGTTIVVRNDSPGMNFSVEFFQRNDQFRECENDGELLKEIFKSVGKRGNMGEADESNEFLEIQKDNPKLDAAAISKESVTSDNIIVFKPKRKIFTFSGTTIVVRNHLPGMNFSVLFFPTADQFRESCVNQNFSLPLPIMKYIFDHQSNPAVYQKLLKCCKTTFIKISMIEYPHLQFFYRKKEGLWYWDTRILNQGKCLGKYFHKNLWISKSLKILFADNIIPVTEQIVRCDVEKLVLFCVQCSEQDLNLLASNCQYIILNRTTVKGEDENISALENIVPIFKKLKKFRFTSDESNSKMITSKTASNLIKLQFFKDVDDIYMGGIGQLFDVNVVYDYVKHEPTGNISLNYSQNISGNYKTRIWELRNELKTTENENLKNLKISCL